MKQPTISKNDSYYAKVSKTLYLHNPYFYSKYSEYLTWDETTSTYKNTDNINLRNSWNHSVTTKKKLIQGISRTREFNVEIQHTGRLFIPKTPPNHWIQFQHDIKDINGNKTFRATSEHFFTNSLPHTPIFDETTPITDKIMVEWVNDPTKVYLLKQIIAYCMVRDYPIHKFFILIGSGRNGKTQFLKLLQKIIGDDNVISTELETLLSSRFESAKLHKKLACIMGETTFSRMKNTSMLKKLTGGDLINFERKYKEPFDDKNYAKIILATNELPITNDHSDGFFRRPLIVEFKNKFDEGIDIVEKIPERELKILTGQCFKILQSLLIQGKFINQPSIEEAKEQYVMFSNPVSKFILERCVENDESSIPFSGFNAAYNKWLHSKGKKPNSRYLLEKLLIDDGYTIDRSQESNKALIGLKWKDSLLDYAK